MKVPGDPPGGTEWRGVRVAGASRRGGPRGMPGNGEAALGSPCLPRRYPAQPFPEVSYPSTSERGCKCPRETLVLTLRSGPARGGSNGSQDADRANPELFLQLRRALASSG